MHKLHISTQFDSGAIEVVQLERADDIQLRIRKDSAADFAQWFHFCLHGAAFQPVTLRFMNAGESAYPKGWEGYQVVASYDRQEWTRIDTQFDGQEMTARLTPMAQAVYFAYFEPYSYEQHLDLLAEELRLGQNALNAITGEFSSDDLLGVIFSKFCIGK